MLRLEYSLSPLWDCVTQSLRERNKPPLSEVVTAGAKSISN